MAFAVGGYFAASRSIAQDEPLTLRWAPKAGYSATFMVSTSGKRGENIAVQSEDFTVKVDSVDGGKAHFTVTGEPVADSSPLPFRFQRALFPEFTYTVDSMGNTEAPAGQPFPPFQDVPILPEGAVKVGETWSGGPVGILPDANVGPIPFTYTSSVMSVEIYKGERCAEIDTDYKVALAPDAKSLMPFLGFVQGDEPKQAGTGAPIGGVVKDSPANKAGIQPGDFVIAAQGQRIRGWSGLEAILPVVVPGMPVKFRVRRGTEELDIDITPEGVPLATISGVGGLHSMCYFSMDSGLPLKVDLISKDLKFTLTNGQGETQERDAEIHLVMEYQRGGAAPPTEGH
jgi:hypothetical protein